LEEWRDKNNEPQKERKTTAKTTMNLDTSCLIIFAKVFVYNPVVLVTQENLNILKQLKRKASDANIHCAWLSEYRNGIMQKIRSRPKQSNRFIHSLKYKCLSLLI